MLDSIRAVVNRHRPEAVLPRHGHAGASLSLVFAGEYVERIGRRSWRCEPLSLLYKPPGVEHSNHVGAAGLQAVFVEIPPEVAESLIAELPRLAEVRCSRSPRARLLVRRVSERLAQRRTMDFGRREELLHALLFAVLGKGSRRPARDRGAWLSHVREFLHTNYHRPITLGEAAAIGGVHPVHLAQTFRATFGCTFRDYIRNIRLDAARSALGDQTQTIGTIGLAAGFADQAHFSRTFRAQFGQTPGAYRRSLA